MLSHSTGKRVTRNVTPQRVGVLSRFLKAGIDFGKLLISAIIVLRKGYGFQRSDRRVSNSFTFNNAQCPRAVS